MDAMKAEGAVSASKLWSALILARQEIPGIAKTAKNPHFGNAYAPLGEILSTVLPVLHKRSLALSGAVKDGALVVAVIHTETGEVVESFVPLVGATDMQKLGGAMTYAMRYGIGMLLALELDEDDDGAKASQRTAQAVPTRTLPAGAGASAPAPRQAPAKSQGGGKRFQECPSCHVHAVIKGKEEYGGGYVCFKKADPPGCGAKFTDSVWDLVQGGDGSAGGGKPMYGDTKPANLSNDDLLDAI